MEKWEGEKMESGKMIIFTDWVDGWEVGGIYAMKEERCREGKMRWK